MNQNKPLTFSKSMFKHVVISSLLEFGPVILFLASFRHLGIYESTLLLMIATIVSTVVTYHTQRRIPYLALYMAALTLVFGYMTMYFHKPKFIQMRDTLYDATCALTLILGIMINVPFLKLGFDKVIPMMDRAWNKLTHLWIGYFILIAVANEIVRRLFPVNVWFDFKGWVVVATAIFGLVALYLSYEPKEEKGV